MAAPHKWLAHAWGNGARYEILRYALVAAAGILVGVIAWAWINQPAETFDPLGDYPTQIVTSRVAGLGAPSARLGETVNVTGTKCNDTDEPVQVTTTQVWVLSVPAGTQVERTTRGTSTRVPGCTTSDFENPIPPAVAARTEQLLRQGIRPLWRITGCDTPIAPDGADGERRCYESQNFTLLPEAVPAP